MAAKKVECAFLIPVRQDDEISLGDVHHAEAWNWLTDQLHELFNGWTLAPGLYEGAWKSPSGQKTSDESRKYIVAISRRQVTNLRRLLSMACGVFFQQVIYLSVAGEVEFVKGPSNGSKT